jgi:hypothetical protein
MANRKGKKGEWGGACARPRHASGCGSPRCAARFGVVNPSFAVWKTTRGAQAAVNEPVRRAMVT